MKVQRTSGVNGRKESFHMETNQGGTAERISGHSVPCRKTGIGWLFLLSWHHSPFLILKDQNKNNI